jgi:DNA-binding transcriptional regulator of glucitol operon
LVVHALAAVLVVGCLALGWWQVDRARQGNLLSYGYALEWPAFAGFVVFVWVGEVRRMLRAAPPDQTISTGTPDPARPGVAAAMSRPARVGPAYDDRDDEQLAAYNRYLAWLNANPGARRSEYPG